MHLDTLNSKIHQFFQILDTDPGWRKKSGIVSGGAGAGAIGCYGFIDTTSRCQSVVCAVLCVWTEQGILECSTVEYYI